VHRLTLANNHYLLNFIKSYTVLFPKFKQKTIEDVFEFAYAMSFSHQGAHRDHRSGGIHHRKFGEVFINTFQGKLSELAVYNYFFQFNPMLYDLLSPPDFSISGLSTWDDCDLQLNEYHFSIKSTKYYGNLLLLECRDWNELGQYIPNLSHHKPVNFDYFVLVRIKPDGEGLLKHHRLLYLDKINKTTLFELITNLEWYFDIPGYLSHKSLIQLIHDNQKIPQGAFLNQTTKMDADNYYIQSGDLCNLATLISEMKNEL